MIGCEVQVTVSVVIRVTTFRVIRVRVTTVRVGLLGLGLTLLEAFGF